MHVTIRSDRIHTVRRGYAGLFRWSSGVAQLATVVDGDFAGLIVAHRFGLTAPNIPESVLNSLLNIVMVGVGGYVVGRSGEKIADKYKGPN